MRYINIDNKTPPQKWLNKAQALTQSLNSLNTMEKRKLFIQAKKNRIWKYLYNWLFEISNGKCWYSEAKEIFSYYEIDHFRPKLQAKELDKTIRDGYWWFAYDWKNYRLCGSLGNRSKSDYFPLRRGTLPAIGPGSDIRDESNYLLDPTNPDDPALLIFDESGYPKPLDTVSGWNYDRVRVTIQILNLDCRPLVDARKMVWQDCKRLINKADVKLHELNITNSVTVKTELQEVFGRLREMIDEKSELSATAICCLIGSGREWAIRLSARI